MNEFYRSFIKKLKSKTSQFQVPTNFNIVDMMSGELSDKLQLSQSNKSLSKTGQLNTPDVSMEQSKSRNNLDQQEEKRKKNYAFMSLKGHKTTVYRLGQ